MSGFHKHTLGRMQKSMRELFDKQRSMYGDPYVMIVRDGALSVTADPSIGVEAQYADASLTNVLCDFDDVTLKEVSDSNGLVTLGDRMFTLLEPAFLGETLRFSELRGVVPTLSPSSAISLRDIAIYPSAGDETWTLEFTSSLAFTVTGVISGGEGTGDIETAFNPSSGKFQIGVDCWTGKAVVGDKLEFTISQSDWKVYQASVDETLNDYSVMARKI